MTNHSIVESSNVKIIFLADKTSILLFISVQNNAICVEDLIRVSYADRKAKNESFIAHNSGA